MKPGRRECLECSQAVADGITQLGDYFRLPQDFFVGYSALSVTKRVMSATSLIIEFCDAMNAYV